MTDGWHGLPSLRGWPCGWRFQASGSGSKETFPGIHLLLAAAGAELPAIGKSGFRMESCQLARPVARPSYEDSARPCHPSFISSWLTRHWLQSYSLVKKPAHPAHNAPLPILAMSSFARAKGVRKMWARGRTPALAGRYFFSLFGVTSPPRVAKCASKWRR